MKVTFHTNSGATYSGTKLRQPRETCDGSIQNEVIYRSPQIALPNAEALTKVVISASTDDAFWAKTAIVKQYDKGAPDTSIIQPYEGRWDVGQGFGWCLSTDPSDTSQAPMSEHIWGAGCVKQITLQVNGPIKAN